MQAIGRDPMMLGHWPVNDDMRTIGWETMKWGPSAEANEIETFDGDPMMWGRLQVRR